MSVALCFFFFFSPILSSAQKQQPKQPTLTRIEFLFDASQSMFGKWQSGTKMDVAKKLMNELLDSLRYVENIEVGLRVFGHLKKFPPQDCDDTQLEVPFEPDNFFKLKAKIKSLIPKGTTPIARSLEACANDFPSDTSRNIIILITDGIEECQGDPCAVSLAMQKKGIVLKPFIIGLSITEEMKKAFDCVGIYFDATNEVQFKNALRIVISQALNSTTLQVNLLDIYNNPTETNVAMTFYDVLTGAMKYHFTHTLNSRGFPDTLRVDPLSTYRIVVHTIPSVQKDSVSLTPGKHNIVGIDAPQGSLNLKVDGNNEYKKLQCIVRKKGTMATLNLQEFNSTSQYLVGKYDLEIFTLPKINLDKVDIAQSKTTTVQIPQPGIVTILTNGPGYGSLMLEEKNSLTLIYMMNEYATKETIVLQPGNYRIVYRPKNSKGSEFTLTKTFRITSGTSITLTIN
ncbi:MAG: VWA domain-containing protein [Bacteroidia bacterium]|nr:VWA domain-containing protein [Bacteroidia bacterium]